MTGSRPNRQLRRVTAFLALAGLVTGCTGGSPSASNQSPSTSRRSTPSSAASSASRTPRPPPRAPAVGTCRRLDYAAISRYSNTAPPVPCKQQHTAYTFAVRQVPASVSVPGVSIGNKSIQDAAARSCHGAFARFIGGTSADRALSRISVTYFLPPQAGFDRGARWVRCDAIALRTHNQLAALPVHLRGLLDKPDSRQAYGVCATGAPGAAGTHLVICAAKHAYRALAALRLGSDSARYPGRKVAATQGQQRCADLLKSRLGASGGYTYAWTFPTVADWSKGQRFGYCWLESSK